MPVLLLLVDPGKKLREDEVGVVGMEMFSRSVSVGWPTTYVGLGFSSVGMSVRKPHLDGWRKRPCGGESPTRHVKIIHT